MRPCTTDVARSVVCVCVYPSVSVILVVTLRPPRSTQTHGDRTNRATWTTKIAGETDDCFDYSRVMHPARTGHQAMLRSVRLSVCSMPLAENGAYYG